MKLSIATIVTIATMALLAGISFSAVAEEQKPQDHEQHHAAEQPADKKPEATMGHMMGGKMDMGQMHEMMGECMKMHKDGNMCEGQMMEQCQKNMEKGDCSKMMKKAKKMKKSK